MALRTERSFCRLCMGHCGVRVAVDEQSRVVSIDADRDDPFTLGYACFKGLQSDAAHNSSDRILHALKRQSDGSFEAIAVEKALDEIADRLRLLLKQYGASTIGG